jgi:LDH2 family malate/lactate/ureidoglycolate dehydrogenase
VGIVAEERVCRPEAVEAFVAGLCRAMGADDDVAAEVGRHLVRANLSGHDSHGVLRMPQHVEQADRARDGISLPDATWRELARLVDRFGVPLPV